MAAKLSSFQTHSQHLESLRSLSQDLEGFGFESRKICNDLSAAEAARRANERSRTCPSIPRRHLWKHAQIVKDDQKMIKRWSKDDQKHISHMITYMITFMSHMSKLPLGSLNSSTWGTDGTLTEHRRLCHPCWYEISARETVYLGTGRCSSRSSCLRVAARKSSAASKVPEQEALWKTMPWDWRHCHCDAKTSQLDKGWAHCAAQNHVSHLYIWLPQSNRSRVICARPQRSPEPLQTTLWILIAW